MDGDTVMDDSGTLAPRPLTSPTLTPAHAPPPPRLAGPPDFSMCVGSLWFTMVHFLD